jgi:methylmalonyl-CoA carboxyltransferase large subunit
MGIFLPLSLLAGWIAGTFATRRLVRHEMRELRSLLDGNRATSGAPAQTASAQPRPDVPGPGLVRQTAAPAPAPQPAALAKSEEIGPEVLMVLSAAVAAFLGKKARIRAARFVRQSGGNVWAQQGRVFVQASHNLGVRH